MPQNVFAPNRNMWGDFGERETQKTIKGFRQKKIEAFSECD
jgi:hypothetical protein